VAEAANQKARVVCFPEAYLPGLRGQDFDVSAFDEVARDEVMAATGALAKTHGITVILGTETCEPGARRIAAVVFGANGELVGTQLKNQLDPAEEAHYVPGEGRRVFEADGLRFGVAICHEGFRYPETVRWAATRGASVVFHPHLTGSDRAGTVPAHWGDPAAPYYEKAVMMRAIENTIYVASVNYAVRRQESATCLVTPAGECQARLPYGEEGVLVQAIDPAIATGRIANRYAPDRYREVT
jgi:predicted amidohydrolase